MRKLSLETYIKQLPELKLNEIKSVYIGKPNSCMCGCSGTYYYVKATQKEASKDQGYEVTDNEINEQKVNYVLTKLKKQSEILVDITPAEYIFTKIIGQTQYTIYTTKIK